jgi:hypothetical protein
MTLARALWLLAVGCACDRTEPPPPPARALLSGGAVARVGAVPIAGSTVERIASAQRLEARSALDNAISDALLSLEARARIPASSSATIGRAAAARALLESLARNAVAAGPPSDAEIAELSAERWIELDRPEAARVTHAVALLPKAGDAARARSVAESVLAAVRGARDPESFMALASAVPHGEIEVRAERLPYITADGRGIASEGPPAPAGNFDGVFAHAANNLKNPGDHSEIIETHFGYHVILLEERLPEQRVPLADRRRALLPEVLSRRAAREKAELVAKLGTATRPEVARDADELTALLVR